MPIDPRALKELEYSLGPANVITDPARIFAECYDAWLQIFPGRLPKMPDVIVRPLNEFEVSEVLQIANRYKIPVGVAGFFSYKLPYYGGILIQTTRMTRIHEVNLDEMYAVIDAGVTFNQFFRYCREKGYDVTIPITTAPPNTSIVANFLFKGIGMNMCYTEGNQDALTALEVVLPTGEIVKTGSWSLRTSSCKFTFDLGWGPQLTRIFVGALGTLGVATKGAIKLWPKPKALTIKILGVDSVEDMAKHFTKINMSRLALGVSGGHWLLATLHGTPLKEYWGFKEGKKIYDLTDEDVKKMQEWYGFPKEFYIIACQPHYISEDEAKLWEKMWSDYLSKHPELMEYDPEEVAGGAFARIETSLKFASGMGEGEPGNQRIRYCGWVPGHIWAFYGSVGLKTFPKLHQITWEVGRSCGLVPALHAISLNEGRVAHVRYMVPIERADPKGLALYAKFFGTVIPRVMLEAGFTPARCIGLGARVTYANADPGFIELYKRIKKALDPNNIMAPTLTYAIPPEWE